MDIYFITKIACLYVIVATGEMLNDIARTVCLNKRMGVKNAKMMSMLRLYLFVCLYVILTSQR